MASSCTQHVTRACHLILQWPLRPERPEEKEVQTRVPRAQRTCDATNNSPCGLIQALSPIQGSSPNRVSMPLGWLVLEGPAVLLTAPPHTPPCHMLALWELSLNNTLMEKFMKNQIIAAGRELKPFFIPRIPGPRLRAPPWEHRESHPSLWPAITGTDYSCNSLLIGSGAGTAVNGRLQPCLPSRGCHQHRPRQNAMAQWTGIPTVLVAALALARALGLGTTPVPTSILSGRLLFNLQHPAPMPPSLGSLL